MKTFARFLAAAVLVVTPPLASAATAATPAPAAPAQLTVAQVLPVCESVLDAALSGRDALAELQGAVKDLPEAQRNMVVNVCAVYLSGAFSMRKRMGPPEIPAGDTKSI